MKTGKKLLSLLLVACLLFSAFPLAASAVDSTEEVSKLTLKNQVGTTDFVLDERATSAAKYNVYTANVVVMTANDRTNNTATVGLGNVAGVLCADTAGAVITNELTNTSFAGTKTFYVCNKDDHSNILGQYNIKVVVAAKTVTLLSGAVGFTVANDDTTGLYADTKELVITLPSNADVNLASVEPELKFKEAGVTVSPTGPQNFTNGPVDYTFTSQDGKTGQNWKVTVRKANDVAKIIDVTSPKQLKDAIFTEPELSSDPTDILLLLKNNAYTTSPATFEDVLGEIESEGDVEYYDTAAKDWLRFDGKAIALGNKVHKLRVVSSDRSMQKYYNLTVRKAGTAANLTKVATNGFSATPSAEDPSKFILEVPRFVDLSNLAPDLTFTTGATISPEEGAAQDFTDSVANPIVYTVTSEDGNTVKTYYVTIKNAVNDAELISLTVPGQVGETTYTATDTPNLTRVEIVVPASTALEAIEFDMVLSEDAYYSVFANALLNQRDIANNEADSSDPDKKLNYDDDLNNLRDYEGTSYDYLVDFTDSLNKAIEYTVKSTAGDAINKYDVIIRHAGTTAVINEYKVGTVGIKPDANKVITHIFNPAVDLTAVTPDIAYDAIGTTSVPADGATVDLSDSWNNPVTYVVTSEDGGAFTNYTVKVRNIETEADVLDLNIGEDQVGDIRVDEQNATTRYIKIPVKAAFYNSIPVAGTPVIWGDIKDSVEVSTGATIHAAGGDLNLKPAQDIGAVLKDADPLLVYKSGTLDMSESYFYVRSEDKSTIIRYVLIAEKVYTVTVDPAITNGTVAAAPGQAMEKDTIQVTVTPKAGYVLTDLTATTSGASGTIDFTEISSNHHTFLMPAADVVIKATFELADYKIITSDITNGTVTTSPAGSAKAGAEVTVTVTPDDGYELVEGSLKVNGTAITGGKFVMPAEDANITAEFTAIGGPSYTVTVSSANIASDKATAAAGTTVTLSPAAGYKFTEAPVVTDANGAKVAVTANSNGTYSFTMPEANVTVTGTVEETSKFPITAPENVVVKAEAATGEKVMFSPAAGYKFQGEPRILDANGNVVEANLVKGTDGSYSFTMPSHAVTIDVTVLEDIAEGALRHKKYMQGYENGDFRPDNNMSRAEAAQMFFNLLTAEQKASVTKKSFTDVGNKWYKEAVETLAGLGIVNGMTTTTFAPEAKITRAQFVTMATRFKDSGVTVSKTEDPLFPDVPNSQWYFEAVQEAAKAGWVKGYPGIGTFQPENKITRAEVVTTMNRLLERYPDKDFIDDAANAGSMVKFADVTTIKWFYHDVMEATNNHDYKPAAEAETWVQVF